jgi:HSP20 family molecular chaperone IbpA
MADNVKTMEVEKEELTPAEGMERTREGACFVPRADIYEVDEQIVIVADVPGVDENSVEITLEKNILTINAYTEPVEMEGFAPVFAEYEVGDFQRSFKLSDEIDRDKIKATIKDGVLRLFLPKAATAQARKISVKAG